MKNLYKFFLALGVYSTVFSQIPEIKRLPVQEISQSIIESTPFLFTKVKKLIKEFRKADKYEVTFDIRTSRDLSLSSGIYFYKFRAGSFVETKKMVYLK